MTGCKSFLAVGLLLAKSVFAAGGSALQAALNGPGTETGRMSILLDKGWRFLFVGDDSATTYARSKPSGKWSAVTMPHVFPSVKGGGAPAKGYGWYLREVAVPDSFAGKDLFLAFEGVCLYADVFVNGTAAPGSRFAYMPFSINVTAFAEVAAPLKVAVRVDSRLHSQRIPDGEAKGWRIYGGIGREVALVARPRLRIDNVRTGVFYCEDGGFDVRFSLKPVQGKPWDSVAVSVAQPGGGESVANFTIKGTDTLLHIKGVLPWTPENPHRYVLSFTPFFGTKPGAAATLLRGFCQLKTSGTKLLLNGRPYNLRGVARHDLLGLDGRPPGRPERRRDLADIKSLGANFLRIAHFPQHRDVYELCDSIGLLVMDEIPAWKTDPKFLGSNEGREYGAAYMRELIDAHGNYTSVFCYSAGNQFKSYKTAVADYVGAVVSSARKADPSRLVTFCSYYYFWDRAFSHVDLISVNEYFGWELASLDMLAPMLDKIHKEWPKKPVIVTELGAQAQRGLRNREARLAGPIGSMLGKDISEDHQALYIGAHMDTIRSRSSFVAGMAVWAYGDYMSELDKKRTNDMPEGINSCGIVTAGRERKMAYEEVRKRYTAWRDSSIAVNKEAENEK